MKKIKNYHLIYILSLILVQSAFAQAPQGMNYQAIARDAGGSILANHTISIRITITNGSSGPTLYKETHSATTNQFGLFTLNVGNGTPDTATFSSISWATTTPWMLVEMDPNGGSNYVSMGTSQLLSVPYALSAGNTNTGQSVTSVFGTGGTTITSADTIFPPPFALPGLTDSITVPLNSRVLITTTGAIQTTAATATGFSVVDILVFINGTFAGQGFYKRVIAANTTGLTGMIANWSLTSSIDLGPGTYAIDVRALYAQGSSADVSGDDTTVAQGSLTATVIKY